MSNRVTSGNPAYVAAYNLDKANPSINFALAYALAQLVLNEGGGPVPTGRRFPIKQARALQKLDLVEIHTTYDAAYAIKQSYTLDSEELVRTHVPVASGAPGTRRSLVTATPEAAQLITRYANQSG